MLITSKKTDARNEHGMVNSSNQGLIEHEIAVFVKWVKRLVEDLMVTKGLLAVGGKNFLAGEIKLGRVESKDLVISDDLLVFSEIIQGLLSAVDVDGHVFNIERCFVSFFLIFALHGYLENLAMSRGLVGVSKDFLFSFFSSC